jgi:hypothetical protein
MVFNEHSPWTTAFDFQAMACVLGFRIFIGGGNKRDNEILDGGEELGFLLT